ncbi:hypothetical protein ABZP36_004968 [Zizania latifolia]
MADAAFETARKIIMHPLYTPRSSPWLDLKVFYVRVSNCEVDESAPDHLTLNHIPLSPDTVIEVNGQRSSMHTEFISSSLRRDRVDKKTEEATFVSTDSIRMTGSIRFQVFDKNDLLLTGDLEFCSTNGVVGESKNSTKRWNMKCQPATSCNGFLKGKLSTGSESVHPVIEVYVAGTFCGTPIVLTKTVQHISRRKSQMKLKLDSIPENETTEQQKEELHEDSVKVSEFQNPKSETDVDVDYNSMYSRQEFIEGEDGELSWFNAGVRVGVGIGLGICVGVGLGVGLLVRTYQSTIWLSGDANSLVKWRCKQAPNQLTGFHGAGLQGRVPPPSVQAMAKAPDLGSDFSQKLLLDLRRRRERLGLDSSAQRSSSNASSALRDAHSSPQRPARSQKPQQGDPRVGRAEAATNRSYQQSGNAIVGAGKPRHRATPTAHSHETVPFQGGGGGGGASSKQKPENNIDVQMALALALSNRGKLQNIELVSRDGSVFFGEPDRMQVQHRGESYVMSPHAHVGKVATGVQKLNNVLMAYSSGGGERDLGGRSSVDIGKELFRGAKDLEESLSMLVMLQEASDYMDGSGHGKVLLLEGRENRKKNSLTCSQSSARLVEIVDEDSETEQPKNAKSLSMQIVPHKKSQSFSPNSSSVLQLSTVTSNSKNNNSSIGHKDDSKVRMPNVIAKLMGLDNLPSTKVVHKGMEKFVKPAAVSRKGRRTNAVGSKLPIQIVGSERVFSKGQNMNFLPSEWKIGLTNSEESESANVLAFNTSPFPGVDKQTRQSMKQMLNKMENAETRSSLGEGIHEDKKLTEETKHQKVAGAGRRTDAGRKVDFLKRFRKNSDRPVTEEKHIVQEKNTALGKKHATSMNKLLGRDSEDKSKRTREKFNKENLAIAEIRTAGKNDKTDQRKRRSYNNKQADKHSIAKKSQNHHEMKSKTGIQNLEDKKSMKSEATKLKRQLPCTVQTQHENGKHEKENGTVEPSDSTHGDGCISEKSTEVVKDSRTTGNMASDDQSAKHTTEDTIAGGYTTGMASPDQLMKQITEATTTGVDTNGSSDVVDQNATQLIDDTSSHTASKTTEIPETFPEEEEHQKLQQMTGVKEQHMEGTRILDSLL